MKYEVVRFNQSKDPQQDLQKIVDDATAKGWVYVNHQYSHYLKPGTSGCFGLGAKPDKVSHVGLVIFEVK